MPAPHSPSVRRRRLSSELRRLRGAKALTLVEAAKRVGLGKSNLSKIESAESKTVPAATLDKLLNLYGVTDGDVRESMHELARLAGERGWWAKYSGMLPTNLADFEVEASEFRTFEAQVIPGLLQVADYSEAVINADKTRDAEEIAKRVAARLKRQEILNRVDPPTYSAVLDEAALRRMVGSAHVMRAQLRHLTHMSARHNVHIHVLPFSAGAHQATEGSFVIMDFADPRDSSIAYVETSSSSLYMEEERELEQFNAAFRAVRAVALDEEQSLSSIEDIIKSLEE
ncbi:DNA-binding Xre family transcriptional regulator [Murinocardiopsis flavida]|uniref:DNA-binding Xre family transcriptional regulator n=1 Tax=Murinocardiopsis flavida TaxID=645275 RepID=A0A2P8DET0_9ACTN|nr:helix-turn-helix transcriptional regulator [Murinocardiopsis flavida]PSK95722.1 DNA-binding Xre family transcriptional regulator [Murinocardiopsis flavida]